MARLKHFSIVPRGGWRYVQPETAQRFEAENFHALCEDVRRHREYKGLAVSTVAEDIERQLCAGLGDDRCRAEEGETHRPVRDLTYQLTPALALSLGRAVAAFVKEGGELVPRETAAARATVCRGCPFNKPAQFCACSAVYATVEALIPRDRREPGVSVCMACGCSLAAKIHLPDTVIAASLAPDLVLPAWCWQEKARAG